jgi:hypothetical protein
LNSYIDRESLQTLCAYSQSLFAFSELAMALRGLSS